jgi:DNA gyrase/topoisomerase IV subunit B
MATATSKARTRARGKLKIGDDWNAITIIALSQSNPLKAIAELVENSIDAKARRITITRGREQGRHFLAIRDDGEGVPCRVMRKVNRISITSLLISVTRLSGGSSRAVRPASKVSLASGC